ncbi:hypothetical protein GCM10028808_74660 [Spirosoma migulaei]
MKATVKITISHKGGIGKSTDNEVDFWTAVKELSYYKTDFIDTYERVLRDKLNYKLKEAIIYKTQNEFNNASRGSEYFIYENLIENYYEERQTKIKNLRNNKQSDNEPENNLRDSIEIAEKLVDLTKKRDAFLSSNFFIGDLYKKMRLAQQLEFSVNNIRYGSLLFDLSIEPAQKALEFFDNNFDYMQVFLEGYIASTFSEIFNIDTINFETNVNAQATGLFPAITTTQSTTAANKTTNTMDKAKWTWALVNGSFIIPLAIAVYLVFSYQSKLEKIQELQDKRTNMILASQDQLIKQFSEQLKRSDLIVERIVDDFFKPKASPLSKPNPRPKPKPKSGNKKAR